MVVAVDPLRREKEHQKKITIGTPFGFNSNQVGDYWKFLSALTSQGYTAYLTDTFKMFFRSENKVSSEIESYKHPDFDIHQEIFAREVKIVKPDLIVTLGTIPRVWFSNLKKGKFNLSDLKDICLDVTHKEHEKLYYKVNYEEKEDTLVPILPLMHLSRRPVASLRKTIYNLASDSADDLVKKYMDLISQKLKLHYNYPLQGID